MRNSVHYTYTVQEQSKQHQSFSAVWTRLMVGIGVTVTTFRDLLSMPPNLTVYAWEYHGHFRTYSSAQKLVHDSQVTVTSLWFAYSASAVFQTSINSSMRMLAFLECSSQLFQDLQQPKLKVTGMLELTVAWSNDKFIVSIGDGSLILCSLFHSAIKFSVQLSSRAPRRVNCGLARSLPSRMSTLHPTMPSYNSQAFAIICSYRL